jgi:hypothetical protein
VVLPERQATICPPRAAQTMRARPIPSTGDRQFASQAVEKTATSLVSSACEPKPVSTARLRAFRLFRCNAFSGYRHECACVWIVDFKRAATDIEICTQQSQLLARHATVDPGK